MGRQGYTRQLEGSSDNLYSVSSVERRRQASKEAKKREAQAGSSSSLKRRQLKYNLAKYKLSRSGRKVKRRLETSKISSRGAQLPSEKVSIWHRDIFMVTPRRMKGMRGAGGSGAGGSREHPRSCVCPSCLAQYGTYHYYRRAMHERRGGRGNSTTSGVNVFYTFSGTFGCTHFLPTSYKAIWRVGNLEEKGVITDLSGMIIVHRRS